MKKAVRLILKGVSVGVAVFFMRKDVSFFTSAVDALTVAGGGICLFTLFSSAFHSESADGMRYAAISGLLGLFPFLRAQSFRSFKEERKERRKKEGVDRESVLFGLTLFLIGAALSLRLG